MKSLVAKQFYIRGSGVSPNVAYLERLSSGGEYTGGPPNFGLVDFGFF